jgi:hypothetical protein
MTIPGSNLHYPGAKRLWDWAPLNGAMRRGAAFMDIDGFLEVKGRFLVLESKPPDGLLSGGQYRALQALSQTPGFHVVVVEGYPPSEVVRWEMMGIMVNGKVHRGEGWDTLFKLVGQWFEWADRQPRGK